MLDNKKSTIILVLRVLSEYSDEEHFLTQQDIIDKIEADYGVSLERKSVAYSLSLLQDLDYDIVKGKRGGYALYSRLFEPSEVQFLVDALFASKVLSASQATALSKKVQSVLSLHQRKNYSYIHKAPQLNRTASKEVFYAIDMVHEGIKCQKRVSFQYRSYDEKGNVILRNGGYRYIVSPYYLVNSNGFYYLICNYREKYAPLQVFRVDLMTNLQIEEGWELKPLSKLKDLAPDFDIATFVNEHIYLFAGEVVDAVVKIIKPNGIQYLRDWFGAKARIYDDNGVLKAKIRCNEDSIFYWLLQYGEEFVLLEPSSLL